VFDTTTFHCIGYETLFLRAIASTAIARISYGNSVLMSWCLSRPGTVPSPHEI